MCGHVGILSRQIKKDHLAFFEQALYADALRGEHGTGVALFDKDFNWNLLKKAINARDFLDLRSYSTLMTQKGYASKFIMGHNRFATRGGINNQASHPFNHGDIIMAHNGSLRGQWRLPDEKEFPVDSENIAHSLNKLGTDVTIPLLDGAYSLVWANVKEKQVNFIRNSERPMWFGLSKDKKTLLYASEGSMIRWIANRNNIELESITSTEVDTLYSFDMSDEHKEEDLEPETKVIKGYTFQHYQANNSHHSRNNRKNNAYNYEGRERTLLASLGLKQGQTVSFDVESFEPYISPKGTPRGILKGIMVDKPYCDVTVYGFNNKDLNVQVGDVLSSDIQSVITPYSKHSATPLRSELILVAEKVKYILTFDDEEEGDDDGAFQGPTKLVSFKKWASLTEGGCSECSKELYPRDDRDIIWTEDHKPICRTCQGKALLVAH